METFPCNIHSCLHIRTNSSEQNVDAAFLQGTRIASAVHQLILRYDLPLAKCQVLHLISLVVLGYVADVRLEASEDVKLYNIQQNAQAVASCRSIASLRQVEEDIATVYKILTGAPVSGLFDVLMQLEDSYGQVVGHTIQKRDGDIRNLHQTHAKELEREDHSDDEGLLIQQAQELQHCMETWSLELSELYELQKGEYHEFLRLLKQQYDSASACSSNTSLDVKQLLAPIFDQKSYMGNSLRKSASAELLSIHVSTLLPPSSPSLLKDTQKVVEFVCLITSYFQVVLLMCKILTQFTLTKQKKDSEEFRQLVNNIKEMGFTESLAESALSMTDYQFEDAVILLVEDVEQVKTYARSQAQVKKSQANKSDMEQRLKQISLGGSLKNKNSSLANDPKRWSPLRLLQSSKTIDNARETTSIQPSLRKLGGWLGAAMDKLRSDSSLTQVPTSTTVSEMFPIVLGTQLRLHYLLNLMQQSLSDHFATGGIHYNAQRAAIASSLYGNDVKVTVLPLMSNQWNDIISGTAGNRSFIDSCSATTEFQFDQLEKQLSNIAECLPQDESGKISLNEGDIFFTRHSNLPHTTLCVHVIVHTKPPKDVDELSLSPVVLQSLRLITQLRSTHKIDMTVPIALLPDNGEYSNSTELSSQLLRRVETVVRCLRGSLTDRKSQSYITGVDSGTLSLLLNVGTASNDKEMTSIRNIVTSFFDTS